MNVDNAIKKAKLDIARLEAVLLKLQTRHKLFQQLATEDVEGILQTTPQQGKDNKKKSGDHKTTKKQKFSCRSCQYTHLQLEKQGVIVQSEVPTHRFVESAFFPHLHLFIFLTCTAVLQFVSCSCGMNQVVVCLTLRLCLEVARSPR